MINTILTIPESALRPCLNGKMSKNIQKKQNISDGREKWQISWVQSKVFSDFFVKDLAFRHKFTKTHSNMHNMYINF